MEQNILADILTRLERIENETMQIRKDEKKILSEILKEEKSIKKEEEIIKKKEEEIAIEEQRIEEQEKAIQALIQKKLVTRKYNDVLEWKQFVWDRCEYKKQKDEDLELEYFCSKMKKTCNFSTCPLNFT